MIPPVVVGAASRDLTDDDRRGWRLGGPATYAGLTLARLGLHPRVLLGVDPQAAAAEELDWLRDAGADLRLVPLQRGPVFTNRERPDGRVQISDGPSDPIPPDLVSDWLDASAWLMTPVADEIGDPWALVPPDGAFVALGWQGLLRSLPPGGTVSRRVPAPGALVQRASLVVVSRFDIDPATDLAALGGLLHPPALLVVTDSELGGLAIDVDVSWQTRLRRYPAVTADVIVDPTGAGDVFLGALVAALLGHPLMGSKTRGSALRFAASAASLAVEGRGLAGVPRLDDLPARLSRAPASLFGD